MEVEKVKKTEKERRLNKYKGWRNVEKKESYVEIKKKSIVTAIVSREAKFSNSLGGRDVSHV